MIKLHIFDMDNTILNTDCDVTWKEFLVKIALAPASALKTAEEFHNDYNAGKQDHNKFLEFQLEEFKGKTKPAMLKISSRHFEEAVKPAIRTKAFDYIKKLIAAGERVAMLTSSNVVLAYPVALYFGITDYIGTELETCDGVFTGKPAGTFPGNNGKIYHLGRFCERYGIDSSEVAAYGDSVNDIPLLESVGTAFAVSPSPALRKHAEIRNWQILDWQD